MKKGSILFVCLAVFCIFLTSCNSKDKKDLFKVGVIYNSSEGKLSQSDYVHSKGIKKMKEDLSLSDRQIIEKWDIKENNIDMIRAALEDCVKSGCRIIFGISPDYMDTMEEMANQYPDVIFLNYSGYKSNNKNFNCYNDRLYEGKYLTGIVAGLKTKSNKIGYVAAWDSDNSRVTSGVNAFAMGVERVNPNAIVYVKTINNWGNETLDREGADDLIEYGCDVIGQHSDTIAPLLAAKSKNVFNVGDEQELPEALEEIRLASIVWNWDAYYIDVVKTIMENGWESKAYSGGLKEGLINISSLSKQCENGTQKVINKVIKEIKSGSLKIYSGELFDNQGNLVCNKDEVINESVIEEGINWYYRNIVVTVQP